MAIETISRYDLRGGVNRLRRQNQNEVYYCQNGRFESDGSITVRDGQIRHVNIGATGNIEALFVQKTNALGLRFYSIRRTTGSNDICYVGATAISGPAFGARDYSSIVEYKGVIFFSNGAGAINYHEPQLSSSKTWGTELWGASTWGTGTTRAAVSGTPTPPTGPFLVMYKDRMYVAGNDENVYWSNAGLYTTLPTVDFPALNFQVVGSTNDPVTGLAVGENFLVAFTSGTYQIMTGVPGDDGGLGDMNWEVFSNIGCIASRSISSLGRKVAFLGSNRRIYILEGSVLTDIDPYDKIRQYLEAPSLGVLRAVASVFYGNELWIYLPLSISENVGRTLVYNTVSQNWTVFTGIDSFAMNFCPQIGALYAGKATESTIYEQNNGPLDPSGSLIPVQFVSRQEVFGTYRKLKSLKKANVQMDVRHGESVAVSYSLENSDSFTAFGAGTPISPSGNLWGAELWGASSWGGFSRQNQFLQPVAGGQGVRATEFRLKLTGNLSPGTKILGYDLDAEIIPRDEEVS